MWSVKIIPEMTYYVSSGTLNPTHSLTHSLIPEYLSQHLYPRVYHFADVVPGSVALPKLCAE